MSNTGWEQQQAVERHLQPVPAPTARVLFVRHARLGGRPVMSLRALDRGGDCLVEADVRPAGAAPASVRPGPYVFPDAHGASAFMTEALEGLIALGCDVEAE